MSEPESSRSDENVSRISRWLHSARDLLSSRLLEAGQKNIEADGITYNVVFTGKLTLPEEQVVANVAAFFKLGTVNAARLLQADRILKTYATKSPADRFARQLTRGGAECRVELEMPEEHHEPGRAQRMAFALESMEIPNITLPHYRQISRRTWIAAGTAAVIVIGVSAWLASRAPVIHGESMAEYEASIDHVASHSGDAEQVRKVYHAVAIMTDPVRSAQSATVDPETAARLIHAGIEGKTAVEVIALAEARLEKQRVAYRQGLEEADRKIAEANQQLADIAPDNAKVLDKIAIDSPAFGWPLSAAGPTIAFRLRNNSPLPLTRIYLQGYLYGTNGKLMASHPLTYAVSGGLPPGQAASVALPMKSDSPWAEQDARGERGLTLRLRVANAEDREGNAQGKDYRPLEAERDRQREWKDKVQAELDAIKL